MSFLRNVLDPFLLMLGASNYCLIYDILVLDQWILTVPW